jgi:hypothetical protein
MKKLIPFLSVLLMMSCGELLPDLSPDTAQGPDLVVRELNQEFVFSGGISLPGSGNSYTETESIDINEDGIGDFKIKVQIQRNNTPLGVLRDNQFAIAVNGSYLGYKTQDIGTCDNPLGYNEKNAILLGVNQLVGESNITCSAWYSNTFDVDYDKAGFIKQTGEAVFVPIKIRIDGKMHFGWIKLLIENTGTGGFFDLSQKITILKVAYATKAGQRVMTGK